MRFVRTARGMISRSAKSPVRNEESASGFPVKRLDPPGRRLDSMKSSMADTVTSAMGISPNAGSTCCVVNDRYSVWRRRVGRNE